MDFDLDEVIKTLPGPGSDNGFVLTDGRSLDTLLLISYLYTHLLLVL